MKPTKLFHATTPKKAKLYRETGYIKTPVRGFSTSKAALAWCVKTHRTVVLELTGWSQEEIHKLPDHHNKFGDAYWVDVPVTTWVGYFNSESDA